MDEAVLTAIENVALTPEAVEAVIMSMQRNVGEKVARSLKKELSRSREGIARMTDAIAAGGELASLVAKLRELEAKKDELIDELATQNCLTTGHDLRSDRPGLQGLNATILPHLLPLGLPRDRVTLRRLINLQFWRGWLFMPSASGLLKNVCVAVFLGVALIIAGPLAPSVRAAEDMSE